MSKKYFRFMDYVELEYSAGPGGEGSSSKRRYRDHMMNIGGNGGNGGDIWIEADSNIQDLSAYATHKTIRSEKGQDGGSHQKKGATGKDTTIKVPIGTLIRDISGSIMVDMLEHGQRFLLAKGGLAGLGNYKRAGTQPAKQGEKGTVVFDLRLLVDVVMVGPSNTGKSAFLSHCTGRDFKVTYYPYTTYHPMWGLCERDWKTFNLMEMPALVGKECEVEPVLKYVRQMHRAKVILYFLDSEIENFDEIIDALKETLRAIDPELTEKESIVVVNKCDIRTIDSPDVVNISLETGEGVDGLLDKIIEIAGNAEF